MSDRLIIMDRGKVIMDGKPDEVFRNVKELQEIGVRVPVGVCDGVSVRVALAVTVGVSVAVADAVAVCVAVAVGVLDGVGVAVARRAISVSSSVGETTMVGV